MARTTPDLRNHSLSNTQFMETCHEDIAFTNGLEMAL